MVTEGQEDTVVKKEDNPVYPLALCLKWGFEPIDFEYLNNLNKNE